MIALYFKINIAFEFDYKLKINSQNNEEPGRLGQRFQKYNSHNPDEFMYNENSSISDTSMDKQKVDEFQKMFSAFQKMATNPEFFMRMMSSVK